MGLLTTIAATTIQQFILCNLRGSIIMGEHSDISIYSYLHDYKVLLTPVVAGSMAQINIQRLSY